MGRRLHFGTGILIVMTVTLILCFGAGNLCRADGVDLTKETYFAVSNHGTVRHNIPVFDGFEFHRLENPLTKKTDNSKAITFTYRAEYRITDMSTFKELVQCSKTYSGGISAGQNDVFLDLKTLMADLGVKDYTGAIAVQITEWKGAHCAGVGDKIDLRLVKISMDAIQQASGEND